MFVVSFIIKQFYLYKNVRWGMTAIEITFHNSSSIGCKQLYAIAQPLKMRKTYTV